MAAESPRRGSRGPGMCVRPQPVNDKSVMESVVDFFQDVAYSSGQRQTDDREKIQWIRFEEADLNDVNANPDCGPQSGNISPLLLVLGYTNGVQVWSIAANGEAQEVLSLRQGPVRTLRLLKTPIPAFPDRVDIYANKRPLIALCDASSAGQPYCCVKFVSLRAGDEVHNVSFSYPVCDIKANDRVMIVAFPERIAAFDACQFKQTFWITSCYPSPGSDPNPIALGDRWLAYSDRKLIPVHQSGGGMAGDGAQSYAATVISAAKTITKGLTMFGETVASSLTGVKSHSTKKESTGQTKGDLQPGIVTIIDVLNIGEGQISVQEDSEGEGLVAHFPAHTSEPISAMAFDPSGMMLLTADKLGHNFHLFRVMAHPWSCSLGAVHHLYTLHRGDTTAEIQNISFTMDSRWVAVSTLRGTTHVFPITPYGGSVSVRTHTLQRVVNRASRFHRSAGIEDMEPRAAGRHSPIPTTSGSPGSSPGRQEHYRNVLYQNSMNNNMGNPRLPPYPHPTTVYPVVQVKQTISIPGMPSTTTGSSKGKTSGPTSPKDDFFCVASCFAKSRGWVAGSPMATKDKTDDKVVDSLYICNWLGNVIEYVLEPRAKTGPEKVTDDSPLECDELGRAQWILSRCATSGELKPPLASNNPLIIGNDAVMYQRPSSSDLLSSQGLMCRQESKESLSSDHSGSGPSGAESDDQWLSQVEIITHAGPHRRLWMGPQFSFKTFQGSSTTTVLSTNSSVLLSHSPEQTPTTMDIVSDELDLQSLKIAAFEECLKDWNPRPEIPEEPSEDVPDWMDDLDNLGPRVVESAQQSPAKQGDMRNVKNVAQMPAAVQVNSKRWSSKDALQSSKTKELSKASTCTKQSKPSVSVVEKPRKVVLAPQRKVEKVECKVEFTPKSQEPLKIDRGKQPQVEKSANKTKNTEQDLRSEKPQDVSKIEKRERKTEKLKNIADNPVLSEFAPPVEEYFSEKKSKSKLDRPAQSTTSPDKPDNVIQETDAKLNVDESTKSSAQTESELEDLRKLVEEALDETAEDEPKERNEPKQKIYEAPKQKTEEASKHKKREDPQQKTKEEPKQMSKTIEEEKPKQMSKTIEEEKPKQMSKTIEEEKMSKSVLEVVTKSKKKKKGKKESTPEVQTKSEKIEPVVVEVASSMSETTIEVNIDEAVEDITLAAEELTINIKAPIVIEEEPVDQKSVWEEPPKKSKKGKKKRGGSQEPDAEVFKPPQTADEKLETKPPADMKPDQPDECSPQLNVDDDNIVELLEQENAPIAESTVSEKCAEATMFCMVGDKQVQQKTSWEEAPKKSKKGKKKRGSSQEPDVVAPTEIKDDTQEMEAKSDELAAEATVTDEKIVDVLEEESIEPVTKSVVSQTHIKLKPSKNTEAAKPAEAAKTEVKPVQLPPPPKVNPWGKPGEKINPWGKPGDCAKLFSDNVDEVDNVKNPGEKLVVKGTDDKEWPEQIEGNKRDRKNNKKVKGEKKETRVKKEDEDEILSRADVEVGEEKAKAGNNEEVKADEMVEEEIKVDELAEESEPTAKAEKEDNVTEKSDTPIAESMVTSQVTWSDSGKKGKKKRKGKNKNGNNSASAQSSEDGPKRAVALEKHQERSG